MESPGGAEPWESEMGLKVILRSLERVFPSKEPSSRGNPETWGNLGMGITPSQSTSDIFSYLPLPSFIHQADVGLSKAAKWREMESRPLMMLYSILSLAGKETSKRGERCIREMLLEEALITNVDASPSGNQLPWAFGPAELEECLSVWRAESRRNSPTNYFQTQWVKVTLSIF